MKNRQLDATLQSAGLGIASLRDLSTAVDIAVVEIPAAVVDKIGAPFVKETVPANTFRGQDQAAATRVMELKNAMSGMLVPMHPGAARFYREKGLAVTN
jgi:TRAP-type uncharacterized transport system substrate-binding protein